MRKSRAAVATPAKPPAPTALFDTSRTSKQPFTWGRVPHADEALTIAAYPDAWAYVRTMECGKDSQYLLLVRWHERMDATAAQVVVLAGWVREERQVSA